jgi:hypothetical protein
MRSEPESSSARRELSSHILSASVVMIGVSTTLIGRRFETVADLIFTCGLIGISAIALFFAYEVI